MSRRDSSKKSSFWDNPFGGFFDFNGDGKEDLGEQWIAHQIFKECDEEDEFADVNFFDTELSSNEDDTDDLWREFCEDGSEFGIYPEDYSTEEEYEEALQEAWNECADLYEEDGSEFGIYPGDYSTKAEYEEALQEARDECVDSYEDDGEYDPEDEEDGAFAQAHHGSKALPVYIHLSMGDPNQDEREKVKPENYPNKRRYNAARDLVDNYIRNGESEYLKRRRACCQFIIESADTVLAANYLTNECEFLYSQAIKDHFELTVSLPDEDETRELEFYKIILKIAKRDIPLSFKVWNWCLDEFLPYTRYDMNAAKDMTDSVIDELYFFPANFMSELVRYMDKNPDFSKTMLDAECKPSSDRPRLIVNAIRQGLPGVAMAIFRSTLAKVDKDWKQINHFAERMIAWSKDCGEIEPIEFYRDNMLPLIKAIDIGMVQDEIDGWETEIAEYVAAKKREYAYSGNYAWRLSAISAEKYGLDPCDYETKQEYIAALQKIKYSWRKRYEGSNSLGLDAEDFETEERYRAACNAMLLKKEKEERLRRDRELRMREKEQQRKAEEALGDKTVYDICGVALNNCIHPYNYLTDDRSLKIGDTVIVPFGDKELEGNIVSIGRYLRTAAPFPVDKMKKVKCKVRGKRSDSN